jgi:hypothetical protein
MLQIIVLHGGGTSEPVISTPLIVVSYFLLALGATVLVVFWQERTNSTESGTPD